MRKVPVTMAMLPAPSAAPSCPAASPGLVDTGEMEVSYSRCELALLWGKGTAQRGHSSWR